MRILSFCALVLALTIGPLPAFAHAPGKPAICPGATPAAVVRSYYAAAVRHDAASAQACLTPDYRHETASFVAPDWVNIVWFRFIRIDVFPVSPRTAPGNFRHLPAQLVQIDVSYVAKWKVIAGTADGPGLWFIYVARMQPHSAWRIGTIGSGP